MPINRSTRKIILTEVTYSGACYLSLKSVKLKFSNVSPYLGLISEMKKGKVNISVNIIAKDHLTKKAQHQAWEVIFNELTRLYQESPQIYRYYYCPSCNWEMESNSLLLKSSDFSDTGPRVPCTRNDLKSSSMRSSFYDTRWFHASFQKRKSTNTPTQLWYLWTITTTCTAQYHKVFIHNKKRTLHFGQQLTNI